MYIALMEQVKVYSVFYEAIPYTLTETDSRYGEPGYKLFDEQDNPVDDSTLLKEIVAVKNSLPTMGF